MSGEAPALVTVKRGLDHWNPDTVEVDPFLDAMERLTGVRPKKAERVDVGYMNAIILLIARVEALEARLDASG